MKISDFLFFINLFFLIIYFIKSFCKKGFIVINFKSIFTLGFLYYLCIPYYVMYIYKSELLQQFFSNVKIYADSVPEYNRVLYIFIIYIFYVSMILFSNMHTKQMEENLVKYKNNKNDKQLLIIYFIIVAFLELFLFYRLRSSLGKGYVESENMTGSKGPVITLSLILFVLSFYIIPPQKKIISIYSVIYIIFALLILSMGGRMYFLTSLICYFIFYSSYRKKIRIRTVFILLIVLGILFSLLGVVRSKMNISIDMILFVLFAEPVFTSFSIFSSLSENVLPVLNFPLHLMSCFINIVPSAVFPMKTDLMIKAARLSNVKYSTPLGAESIFVSLLINFGIVGIPFFSYGINRVLLFLKRKYIPIYYFAISWFVFDIFRDPFSISLIKIIFEICIILPFSVNLINQAVHLAVRKKKKG